MTILAIDPGNTESGFALIDPATCQPIEAGKIPNEQLLDHLHQWLFYGPEGYVTSVAIEMVASYGMAVGKEVFETCVWIGRFAQVVESFGSFGMPCDLVYRADVKLHLCHTTKAKDANITQALIDRFASGQPNRGKGTKAEPGWFFGFRADIWQAYALAVFTADKAASSAKLTSQDIPEVFRLSEAGLSYRQIGERFGVSKYAIYHVVNHKTWRDVGERAHTFLPPIDDETVEL